MKEMSLSFCSRPAEVCSLGVHPLLCVSEYLLIRLISYHYWLTLAVSPCFLASSVSNLFYVNGEETDIDTLTHILSLSPSPPKQKSSSFSSLPKYLQQLKLASRD